MKEKDKDFAFCFKKASGLKLISPNDNLVEVYKRKSRSALNMLNSAIEKDENEWILDTSYYAKYFMAYALFMKVGIKSEIHDCTIFALKSIFKELGIISQEVCKDLEDSRDLRVGSLYYDKDFGKKEILSKADTAPNFCLKVESIVDSISKEDVFKVRKKFEEVKKGVC
jgi:uncharacterized protein (UPF0332 family)